MRNRFDSSSACSSACRMLPLCRKMKSATDATMPRRSGQLIKSMADFFIAKPHIVSRLPACVWRTLPPVGLMDMGFAIIRSLTRHRKSLIRFLFIGSHLCYALLSGPDSRRVLFHPCASLSLHVHHVVKVAVGIPVSWYPPHGSVRALLSA